jgi:hypothetical protein
LSIQKSLQLRDEILFKYFFKFKNFGLINTDLGSHVMGAIFSESGFPLPWKNKMTIMANQKTIKFATNALIEASQIDLFFGVAGLLQIAQAQGNHRLKRWCITFLEKNIWKSPWGRAFPAGDWFFEPYYLKNKSRPELRAEKRVLPGMAHGLAGLLSVLSMTKLPTRSSTKNKIINVNA